MERRRREREKTEVTLTTRNANDSMKKQLSKMNDEEITKNLQQAIADIGMEPTKIREGKKISNKGIKIQCASYKRQKSYVNSTGRMHSKAQTLSQSTES